MSASVNRPKITVIIVIVLTVLAQLPAVSHWIDEITTSHTHLVTIIEGIIGVILLIFATYQDKPGETK